MAVPTPQALVIRASATLAEARKLAKQADTAGPEAALALVQVAKGYASLAVSLAKLDLSPLDDEDVTTP